MSTLKTNAIQTTAGKPILNSTGSVLQVIQTIKTDTFSTTSTTFADVTGLSATITPSSTTSKILILVDIKVGHNIDYEMRMRIARGGNPTNYIGDTSGNRPRSSSAFNAYTQSGTYGYTMGQCGATYLDSPSTTSSTTYAVQVGTYSPNTIYVNRNSRFQNAAQYDSVTASSITLMEISG